MHPNTNHDFRTLRKWAEEIVSFAPKTSKLLFFYGSYFDKEESLYCDAVYVFPKSNVENTGDVEAFIK